MSHIKASFLAPAGLFSPPRGVEREGMVLKTLKILAIVAGALTLELGLVFCEFAGSRWALPGLAKALVPVVLAVLVLALLAIIRPLRSIAGKSLILCGMFLTVHMLASSFVVEAILVAYLGLG
jgi:hypothetical protein